MNGWLSKVRTVRRPAVVYPLQPELNFPPYLQNIPYLDSAVRFNRLDQLPRTQKRRRKKNRAFTLSFHEITRI